MLHPVILAVPPVVSTLGGPAQQRAVGCYARTALARSAACSGAVLRALHKGPRGEPLPSGGLHWSLSHTREYVAAVTAPFPVGIDIERVQPFSPVLKERLACGSEWGLSARLDPALFCRFWTAKEAVLKASGAGLSGLSRCRITRIRCDAELELSFGSRTWIVSQFPIGDGHLAAITEPGELVRWHLEEPEEQVGPE